MTTALENLPSTEGTIRIPFHHGRVTEAYRALDTAYDVERRNGDDIRDIIYGKLNYLSELQAQHSRVIGGISPSDFELTASEWQFLRDAAVTAILYVETRYSVAMSTLPGMREFLALLDEYALPAAILQAT